jgi:hypothetical protein
MIDHSNSSTSTTRSSSRLHEREVRVLFSHETSKMFKFITRVVSEANEFLILCAFGSEDTVRKLLHEDRTIISSTNAKNMNAADFACYGGNIQVAKLLYAFYPDLFNEKCHDLAKESPYDTSETISWLDSLAQNRGTQETPRPNTRKRTAEINEQAAKQRAIDEANEVTSNQNKALEISRAQYYIDCFNGLEYIALLRFMFANTTTINKAQGEIKLSNKLGMNMFHFACYGGNRSMVEAILEKYPELLTSLTKEGLSGFDVFDMSFNANQEFRKWLFKQSPKFFSENEKIVIAAAQCSAPEEQRSAYNTLIEKMIGCALQMNLSAADQCYVSLCTALQSFNMGDKYNAVESFLSTACKIQRIEGVALNTTLVGFEKIFAQVIEKNQRSVIVID